MQVSSYSFLAFHQVAGAACASKPRCRTIQVSFRAGRLVSLQYNAEGPDIPSLPLRLLRSLNPT